MLTKVILEGPMGKLFGRIWNFDIDSPRQALNMVEANKPGLMAWIRTNLAKYSRYKVICEYESGEKEHLDNDRYPMNRKCKVIRFVPLLEGAGGAVSTVLGAVLVVVDQLWLHTGYLTSIGAGMMIGGVAMMLAPKPKLTTSDSQERKNISSYYFDGPTNTTAQGVPVQLVYGKCMVGSHAISAAVTVDQLM